MTEGEFKKRIEEKTIYNAGIKKWGTITRENLDKILDEAAKEFPPFYMTKLDDGTIIFENNTDVYNWKQQAKEWFLKWFMGGVK